MTAGVRPEAAFYPATTGRTGLLPRTYPEFLCAFLSFRKVTGAEAPALFSKPQSHFCPNALQSARKPLPAHALTRDDGGNLYPSWRWADPSRLQPPWIREILSRCPRYVPRVINVVFHKIVEQSLSYRTICRRNPGIIFEILSLVVSAPVPIVIQPGGNIGVRQAGVVHILINRWGPVFRAVPSPHIFLHVRYHKNPFSIRKRMAT